MFEFGDKVKFVKDESVEAVVIYSIKQSYLLWNGEFTLWVNGKYLFRSKNNINPPIKEAMIDLFESKAEEILRDFPVTILNSDYENLLSQITAALVRGYCTELVQSKNKLGTELDRG